MKQDTEQPDSMDESQHVRRKSISLTETTEDRAAWLMLDMDIPSWSQLVRTALDKLYAERQQIKPRNPPSC